LADFRADFLFVTRVAAAFDALFVPLEDAAFGVIFFSATSITPSLSIRARSGDEPWADHRLAERLEMCRASRSQG
jgi:hypothetical protein